MLVAPFVAVYALVFIYPTVQMVLLSFTDAPLIGAGNWIGIDNYDRLFNDRRFQDGGLEHRLFRAADGGARHAGRRLPSR